MTTSDRSFSDVFQDVVRNFQEIVRAEFRLAKVETANEAVKAKSAAVLFIGAAVCGLFAAFFVLLAAVYALTRLLPDWGAALAVAIPVGIAAALLASAGATQWKRIRLVPQTLETLKENTEWAKQQIK